MPYKERLNPWLLVRLIPNAKFVVMFSPESLPPQQADSRYRTSGR